MTDISLNVTIVLVLSLFVVFYFIHKFRDRIKTIDLSFLKDMITLKSTVEPKRIQDQIPGNIDVDNHIYSDHSTLPNRQDTLKKYFNKELRIFSTTADNYFLNNEILSLLKEKLSAGCTIRILLLRPDSPYMHDREFQERDMLESRQKSCREIIEKLRKEFPDKIECRYFRCAPTYQALILDNDKAYVAVPVYGQKGTSDFPCIALSNSEDNKNELFLKISASFESLWTESGSYSYDLIAYHDSWLTVDPIIKCAYKCKYCILNLPKWTGSRPKQIYEIDDSVSSLINHRFFTHDKTVLSFGNRTDPFHKRNSDVTLQFLQKLEYYKVENSVCIATKSSIPKDVIMAVKAMKYINVIFFLSYSGFTTDMEPGIVHKNIKDNFKNLKNESLPFIHFWRPLTPSNSSRIQIREMLSFISDYSTASVIIGLKYSPELRTVFSKEPSLQLPDTLDSDYGEWLPDSILHEIKQQTTNNYQSYPYFRHTSCAVSFILGKPDYNASYYYNNVCEQSNCPESQKKVCQSDKEKTPRNDELSVIMKRINLPNEFHITDNHIFIEGTISQEEYLFLLHNINYPIKCDIGFTNVWHGDVFQRMKENRTSHWS